jgi:transposase
MHAHSVRRALHQWQTVGLYGLWEQRRPGRQRHWQEEDAQAVEQWVQEGRSYTSLQLCHRLAQECDVHLSQRTMSRLLQKRVLLETLTL